MPDEPNIFEIDSWEREYGPVRGSRLGPAAGSAELGCTLYELDAGSQAVPYHAHHGNEELLIVLEGTLELRTPAGKRMLSRGAVAGFPAGPDGAHRVRNASSDAVARYLMISTMRFPEIAEQLDTGTILAMRGPGDGWAWAAGADGDYMELTRKSIEADPG
jgi:uncharacterized cupin superfamily protein